MDDSHNKNEATDGKSYWETILIVGIHAEILLLVILLLRVSIPIIGELLGGFSGPLPNKTQSLVDAGLLVRNWFPVGIWAVYFLAIDAWGYRWLLVRKGRLACTIWSSVVSSALTLTIVWYAYLLLQSLYWIAELRNKV